MNRIVEEFRRDDERVLDKLVDGELSEADRKELLSALDDEPGAWRRCALAFLEAQTWRGDFADLLVGPALKSLERAVQPVAGKSADLVPASVARAAESPSVAPASRVLEYAMGLAACLLLAFGLGIWARGALQGGGAAQFAQGQNPLGNNVTTVQAGAGLQSPNLSAGLSAMPNAAPVLQPATPGISDAMRESLEKAGHRVIHTKQLVPVQLPDGRRALMPVDQVDVEPNVRPAY